MTSRDATSALSDFLAAAPVDMPPVVLAALRDSLDLQQKGLPAQVFVEAVEQSAVAISIADRRGKILYANGAFHQVTGYEPHEVIGQNESILSSKRTPNLVYQTLWGRLEQRKPWSGLLLNARKDGALYVAEVTIAPVVFGDQFFYLGMHRDVTQVHQLQQKVSNQKALIESVVEASPIVTALLDDQGQVILTNGAYRRLATELGNEPVNVMLQCLSETPGWDWDTIRKTRRNFDHYEVSVALARGTPRWLNCSGVWFHQGDANPDYFFEPQQHTYLLLAASDVTTLKRQQEAVATNALRATLVEQEMIQGLQETLEGAIYQLQGPINLIQAALNLLERRGDEPGQNNGALRLALRQAVDAGQTALSVLNDAMPQLPPEHFTAFNLNELLRDVLSVATPRLLAEGIEVDWRPTPVLPALIGRGQRLRSLFKQLIDNAIDAMRTCRRRELRITTALDDGHLVVNVADTGPGVPEHLRLRVFEPFFTTKSGNRQSGMGLAMAREIVNEHGGTLAIVTDYTEGCCVRVVLLLKSL